MTITVDSMFIVPNAEDWGTTADAADGKIAGGSLMVVGGKGAHRSEGTKWFIRSTLNIVIPAIEMSTRPRDTMFPSPSHWHRLFDTNTTTVGEFLLPV